MSSRSRCSTSTPRSVSAAANASCSSCARATHGTPSKSSWSLFRGVSRRSSGPGRCSSTVRSRPTSLVAPMACAAGGDPVAIMGRGWHRPARARPPPRSAALDKVADERPDRPPDRPSGGVGVDLFDLTGKVAVVTGGTRGIGLMMARGLLQAGARVYISSRKAEAGDAAVAELSAPGTASCRSRPTSPARRSACGWPPRSASARTSCTSWSTTPAPRGASRWRPSRSRRGTRCSTST